MIIHPESKIDPQLLKLLSDEGYYFFLRQLADGTIIGLAPMLFTTGLFVGLDARGYARRYCYAEAQDAFIAAMAWDGRDDPPGPWIKEKPSGRPGPGAKE
jgi:hypothetical protein